MVLSPVVEQFDGVLEQVVVEVLVEVQQEVQVDLPRVHHLLGGHCKLVHVPVLELPLDQGGAVEAGHEVLAPVAAVPLVLGDYGLGLVVDVVGGGLQGLSVVELEGAEHRYRPQVEVVDQVVVILRVEKEVGLPHGAQGHVEDEVVVDDALLGHHLLLGLVGHAHSTEGAPLGLPQVGQRALHLVHVVGGPDRVGNLVVTELALGVISQIKHLEVELLVVARLEPHDHGVVVGLAHVVLVGPLVLLGFKLCHRLDLVLQRVGVVGQPEPVVVVAPLLPHAHQPGVGEGVDI